MLTGRTRSREVAPYGKSFSALPGDETECYYNGNFQWSIASGLGHWAQGPYEISTCVDQTHPKRGGHYTEGGSLDIKYVKQTVQPARVYYANVPPTGLGWVWKGACWPIFVDIPQDMDNGLYQPDPDWYDISSYGPQAWNKFKPGKPQADLSVFIAELRDLPKLFKSETYRYLKSSRRRKLSKAGANDFLSYQFGWLPFLNDVRKFFRTAEGIDRSLSIIRKNNGTWNLRKGVVDVSTNVGSWESTKPCFWPAPNYNIADINSFRAFGTFNYTRRVWFSARFRYYIPEYKFKDPAWIRRTTSRLYGLNITPAVLWELVPWSWLIDWGTNMGDCIANLADSSILDDVVAKYAYIMGSTVCTLTQQSTVSLRDGTQLTGTVTRETAGKSRLVANPFGFGLTDSEMSARQWAILGALGIQRR